MDGKEFKVNNFITLKLWEGKTYIYLNNKKFRQCKYVLVNIPVNNIDQYSSINSINEVLDLASEEYPELTELPPEVEFWGHCSNLQAWVENNYNSDLLDIILSFPMLKVLTQEGDLLAKRVFKEEIVKRILKGNFNTILYLIDIEFLNYLTDEEKIQIFSSEECLLFENIFVAFKNGDFEQFKKANLIFNNIGKFLFYPIEKKLKNIFDTENVEDLCVIFNYQMLEVLSSEEILSLSEQPLNFIERALILLNKANYEEIKIEEYGLFYEKVENALENIIKKKFNSGINKCNYLSPK